MQISRLDLKIGRLEPWREIRPPDALVPSELFLAIMSVR